MAFCNTGHHRKLLETHRFLPGTSVADVTGNPNQEASMAELGDLMGLLDIPQKELLLPADFVDADSEVNTGHSLTVDEILELVQSTESQEDDSEPPHPVTLQQAVTSLQTLTTYLEQDNTTYKEEIDALQKLHSKLDCHFILNAKQKKLTDYFTTCTYLIVTLSCIYNYDIFD